LRSICKKKTAYLSILEVMLPAFFRNPSHPQNPANNDCTHGCSNSSVLSRTRLRILSFKEQSEHGAAPPPGTFVPHDGQE